MLEDFAPQKTVTPLGPWIVVQPLKHSERTPGGLYKPQGNMEERLGYDQGIVEAVGPGKPGYSKRTGAFHEHSGLAPGDRVLFRGFIKEFNKLSPYNLADGRCVLHQDDILGVITECPA